MKKKIPYGISNYEDIKKIHGTDFKSYVIIFFGKKNYKIIMN